MNLRAEAESVRETARRAAGAPDASGVSVEPLAGDASTRRYYRVRFAAGAPWPSAIVMRHDEEIPPGAELPFVNAHRYLARAGLPVPAIYLDAPDARSLVLEDFGDRLLEDAVADEGFPRTVPLYEGCVEILVRLQADGTAGLDDRAQAKRLQFDVAKFAWEIDFFFEHAVRGFGGLRLPDGEERAIEDDFAPLLEELCALPRVLAHRDYHSRNVMVTGGAERPLGILDFQDARMGNVFYDLASLLRDSYVTLPPPVADRLVDVYRSAATRSLCRDAGDPGAFPWRLDLAALQRNVKALGTFGYQAHARGKALYLRYVPPTVRHIEENFGRNTELRALKGRLMPLLSALSAKAAEHRPA